MTPKGCGVEHLRGVQDGSVDVLIVDAAADDDEGLLAPTRAFRSPAFWQSVARAMNPAGAAFGLNLVGSAQATDAMQQMVLDELPGWSLRSVPPPPGGLPDLVELDHRLLFGTLGWSACGEGLQQTGLMGVLLDDEKAWLEHWGRHPIVCCGNEE